MAASRASRADDIAVIEDHRGCNAHLDDGLVRELFRELGWAMLSDEAVERLADKYERHAASRDRINAGNRAIREMQAAA